MRKIPKYKFLGLLTILVTSFSIQTRIVNAQTSQEPGRNLKRIEINQITISGNTVFSNSELKKYLANYQGKKISLDSLNELVQKLTNLYIARGYLNSGVYLPQQEIKGDTIKLQVVEGQIERIEIKGLNRLNPSYLSSYFSSLQNKPLNTNTLEDKLKTLKQNAAIKNLNAELLPGTRAGASVLLIEVEEASPWQNQISFNNFRSSYVGEYQGTVETSYYNLIGVSDFLSGNYNLSSGFDSYAIGYAIPIAKNNGTFSLEYRNGDSRVIGDFEEVGIRAESNSFSINYRQPIIYRANREISLGIGFERQDSQTFILDDLPYSYVEGPQDGRSVMSVLSLTGDWLERGSTSVLAVRSELNFGLDLFDATVNDDAPDGLFFSWQGQAQWTKALSRNNNWLFVARLTTQLTPDALLPLEQFTLGGANTVRGYRQNREIGDNGVVANLELYIPLFGDVTDASQLKLIPFVDLGKVWNVGDTNSSALNSFGAGISWQFKEFLSLRIDYGIPLVETEDRSDSLQDNGIFFSFELKP